jgi:hypothetical protein
MVFITTFFVCLLDLFDGEGGQSEDAEQSGETNNAGYFLLDDTKIEIHKWVCKPCFE